VPSGLRWTAAGPGRQVAPPGRFIARVGYWRGPSRLIVTWPRDRNSAFSSYPATREVPAYSVVPVDHRSFHNAQAGGWVHERNGLGAINDILALKAGHIRTRAADHRSFDHRGFLAGFCQVPG
jgi:hypothetical protein